MGVGSLKRAVFFDRDGVLNDAIVRDGKPYPPASVGELRIEPAAAQAIEMLRSLGFATIAITNQPDVARGTQDRQTVERINAEVQSATGIDAVYTCYHDDRDACDCRKPKPGLILRACREVGLDASGSYLIGDRMKDIEAARAARCSPVFIDRSYAETVEPAPGIVVRSFDQAIQAILQLERTPAA